MEDQNYEADVKTQSVWLRGLFMLLFAIGFSIGQFVLNVLAVVQFLWLLFARSPNEFIQRFGASLAVWFADVVRFMTGETEEKPFPWRAWP